MSYLNQTRVRESFIGQIGAIESFTKTATKEGSVEVPIVKVPSERCFWSLYIFYWKGPNFTAGYA
jgi:hypothetical protein